ncbi:transposase InsO family protein [Oerskovia enterophila]
MRTRVRMPGQNGSRERGFGSLKYERLFLEEIDDVLQLVAHADAYRTGYNTVRPHEASAWNQPLEVQPRPRRPPDRHPSGDPNLPAA